MKAIIQIKEQGNYKNNYIDKNNGIIKAIIQIKTRKLLKQLYR